MQHRDLYEFDYIYKYIPKTDLVTYQVDMFNKNVLHSITLTDEQQVKFQEMQQSHIYRMTGTLVFSLAVILGHRKIPLIKKIEKPWKKFFWKLSAFLLPIGAMATYGDIESQMTQQNFYVGSFEKYQNFKLNGDVKELNDQVLLYKSQ